MTRDIESIDGVGTGWNEYCFQYANWALKNELWNGRLVMTSTEMDQLRAETAARTLRLLFEEDDSELFAMQLAWIGTDPAHRTLLSKDIEELKISDTYGIQQVGFHKSVKKFWKKHKTEILIGVGVLALVTVIVVVSVCTAGTATGAAAAAGGAAAGGLNPKEKRKKKEEEEEAALGTVNK